MKVDRDSSRTQSRSEPPKTEKAREAPQPQQQKPAAAQPQKAKAPAEFAGQSTFKPAGQRPPVALQAPQANTLKPTAGITSFKGGLGGIGDFVGDGLGALGNAANGALNTANNIIGGGASALQQAAQLFTSDPGANHPNAIDRANLSQLDKAVINGMGLDSIPPGGSLEIEVEATGHLAAVLGVEVGTSVTMTVERSAENPNEFTMGFGGGASLDGIATGDTAGAEATAGVGVGVNAGIELTVDLSQSGAATELAAFAVHTGVMASLPPVISGPLMALEELPGVTLPGEPLQFIRDHLSAIEVGADGHLSGELSAVVGVGVTGTAEQYLSGGGRIEFNQDGTLTVSGNMAVGGGVTADVGVGGGGFDANVTVGGFNSELGFQASFTVQPGPPPRELDRTYSASLSMGASVLGAGMEGTISVDLESTLAQAPADVRNRMNAALRSGNLQEAANIFRNEILPHVSVTGSLEINATASAAGGVEGEIMVAGVGGGLGASASVTTTVPVTSASVTLDSDSVAVTGSLFGRQVANEDITYQQLMEMARRAAG
jgi:hypothetical protein